MVVIHGVPHGVVGANTSSPGREGQTAAGARREGRGQGRAHAAASPAKRRPTQGFRPPGRNPAHGANDEKFASNGHHNGARRGGPAKVRFPYKMDPIPTSPRVVAVYNGELKGGQEPPTLRNWPWTS